MKAYFKLDWIEGRKALIPADDDTYERLKKRKVGEVFQVDFKLTRNYKFLKKAHALIKFAFDLQDTFEDKENFRNAVTIEAGYYTTHKSLNGDEWKEAKSWSFAKTTEEEFEEMFSAMVSAMILYKDSLFNGIDPDVFVKELGVFLDGEGV